MMSVAVKGDPMYRSLSLSALLLLALAPGPAAAQDDNTKLRSIKYDDLGKLVRSYKGKPIVVYFWHYS
jgi:hypothetical protein